MKSGVKIFLGFVFLSVFMGCVAQRHLTTWNSRPAVKQFSTDAVDLQIKPLKQDNSYYVSFELMVRNKTGYPIEIDWNETRYIHQGRESGVFVFGAIDPEQLRTRTIPKETVAPGVTITREISPARTITWTKPRKNIPPGESCFSAGIMPNGDNGVSLLLSQQGQRWRKTLTVRIVEQHVGY